MINDPELDIGYQPETAKLFTKMASIMGDIDAVPKDGWHGYQNYKYSTASAVAEAIRKLMAKYNVAFLPETVEVKDVDKRWLVVYRFTFACGDTGATYSCRWVGEAQNANKSGGPDDKALAKCATIAQKYFLLKTFNVSSEDDPDEGSSSKPPPTRAGKEESIPAPPTPPAPATKANGNAPAIWTPETTMHFGVALTKRFPTLHTNTMLAAMGKKSLSELGATVAEAARKAQAFAYDPENCCPFVADVVKYVDNGSNKFLVFRADDDLTNQHIEVQAYGRSTEIKDGWLGDYAYKKLGFDKINKNPNKWLPLPYSVVVHYEAKHREDDGSLYYAATGLGHSIVDPATLAEEEVDF